MYADSYGGDQSVFQPDRPSASGSARREAARMQAQKQAASSWWGACYTACCTSDRADEAHPVADSMTVLDDRPALSSLNAEQQLQLQQKMLEQQHLHDQQRLEQMQQMQQVEVMHGQPGSGSPKKATGATGADYRRQLEEEEDAEQRRIKAEQLAAQRAAEEARREEEKRIALGELGYPSAFLQVQLDSGWVDMSADEFKQVCDHIAGGETRFSIQARGTLYIIDWSDSGAPKQINALSQKIRNIRIAHR
eukprot:TRINITY_DN23555_c0_g1_i2.p1 TRINITY_DN23555_c0_g1~~TRINITY_DN23555_c0_g1_i2.p1  ORF type:complete len:250 (+),score=65.39 TRINITY_DN23555_c0_g1_i2:147-896(+)